MPWYITKYALEGIILEPFHSETVGVKFLHARLWETSKRIDYLTIGENVFNNLPDAQAKAEQMRATKIASLEKQIKKLKQLKF